MFLYYNFILFSLAIIGLLSIQKSLIILLIMLEILLLSINLNFIFFSIELDDLLGQTISLFLLTLAAVESSIGLALVVIIYRNINSIELNYLINLKS